MASTELKNTNNTTGNRKTGTMSFWVKRSKLGLTQYLYSEYFDGNNCGVVYFSSADTLNFISYAGGVVRHQLSTNRKFRDTSAWYHIHIMWDTTDATADDRQKIYVNGLQETSFSTRTNPTQNIDTYFGLANSGGFPIRVGSIGSSYFDGSFAHFHRVDGQALAHTVFGSTDSTTGIWKPITSPSITYTGSSGHNFFLKFENSGSMGTDSSGNANNFTVNGTMTQTIDTPSNVFSTLNPLSKSNATFTNGNTTGALTSNTDRFIPASTLKVSQGKWYAEFKLNSLTDHTGVGITGDEGKASNNNNAIGKETNSYAYVSTDGNFYDADSGSAYGSTYTSNDIIGIALDLDNNYIYFSKNGTWQNSGDPTSGATGTGGKAITDPASVPDGFYAMGVGSHSTGGVCNWSANFGNGYFGTTKITSPYNDSNGIGLFSYEPPTNFLSLCTKSINAQEYD